MLEEKFSKNFATSLSRLVFGLDYSEKYAGEGNLCVMFNNRCNKTS